MEITDEQVERVFDRYKSKLHEALYFGRFELAVDDLIKSLTDQQLIDLLKERGYSEPPKWVEFDAEDESTWPMHFKPVMTDIGQGYLFRYKNADNKCQWNCVVHRDGFCTMMMVDNVKRWYYLPKPPTKGE